MTTIKLDHIELLVRSTNYDVWQEGIGQVLQSENLWGHIKGNINAHNHLHPFAKRPEPAVPNYTTANVTEIECYNKWWLDDSKAKTIVLRLISPVSLLLLPQGLNKTVRIIWDAVKALYVSFCD
ncbi:hypothetical protein CVT25_013159 [Psilocybe cyanescens]|uniref:Retrotransposon Copia-like N-terminal domain-containing protein n=1 Tax=Psilocybe cyanescens TaxID=93625 RepID=A0A409WCH0_PSICY|nr:hypothetical protein CVT25_013159 [Psilocybe cyanescens]